VVLRPPRIGGFVTEKIRSKGFAPIGGYANRYQTYGPHSIVDERVGYRGDGVVTDIDNGFVEDYVDWPPIGGSISETIHSRQYGGFKGFGGRLSGLKGGTKH
jgi:hypothetical protein